MSSLNPEILAALRGGERPWFDLEDGKVVSATLYLAQGCPDLGERDGVRNDLCIFCDLPNAKTEFLNAFFDGRPMTDEEHLACFAANCADISPDTHTLMVFNAGSFLADVANPPHLRKAIADTVAKMASVRRFVIEARAILVTREAVKPLADILGNAGKKMTIRIGVETQDDHLRNQVLKKGHSRRHIKEAVDIMHDL